MKTLSGNYNRDGYTITDETGEIVYEAGNNPLESSSRVRHDEGLDLRTIRRYCIQTGREMAAESGAEFARAERVEDDCDE